jgi:hypothetical protein
VKRKVHFARSPQGDPLDAESVVVLQRLIDRRGVRSLVGSLGVSVTALTRAAAGLRVLAGTRALIVAGLERMRAAGEVPEPEAPATMPRRTTGGRL